jgi:hypothetical protein
VLIAALLAREPSEAESDADKASLESSHSWSITSSRSSTKRVALTCLPRFSYRHHGRDHNLQVLVTRLKDILVEIGYSCQVSRL